VVVHTVGHSTLPFDRFLRLLGAHGIVQIADVRQYPASRRHPHFARDALEKALPASGIAYAWLPALGGRRKPQPGSPHVAWRNPSFRAYADHMDDEEFRTGIEALLALAAGRRTAIMCAEAVPWRCHRQLVSDALLARGVDVGHIISPEEAREHRLTPFARLDGTRVMYDGGQLALPAR
jgi:uncharacterized protein (DUF488 family)